MLLQDTVTAPPAASVVGLTLRLGAGTVVGVLVAVEVGSTVAVAVGSVVAVAVAVTVVVAVVVAVGVGVPSAWARTGVKSSRVTARIAIATFL
ncbi:MAG: hypothetical protein ACYC66_15040 [Chloroflexota bacterium]